MIPPTRRIVTNHAADGRSIVTTEGQPPVVIENFCGNPGLFFTEVWRTSGDMPLIDNGPDPTGGAMTLASSGAGSTFRLVDFPASTRDPADPAPTHPDDFTSAMHRTQSVDCGIVLSGQMRLVLTDSDRILNPGDIVIQRGTDHAWANRSAAPARMAFILIAGQFAPDIAAHVAAITP